MVAYVVGVLVGEGGGVGEEWKTGGCGEGAVGESVYAVGGGGGPGEEGVGGLFWRGKDWLLGMVEKCGEGDCGVDVGEKRTYVVVVEGFDGCTEGIRHLFVGVWVDN